MKALLTAEVTEEFVTNLESLGYTSEITGWGATRTALTEDELIDKLRDVSLLVCELEQVTERVLDKSPDLKIIASARANPTNVDTTAAEARGIWVLNTPGRNADSVADFTIAAILASQRRIVQADDHIRNVGWNLSGELPYFHFRGREIGELTIGLLGYGAIGRRVAQRLVSGFGAKILTHDLYVREMGEGCEWVEFDELFERSAVVSLHAAPPSDGKPLIGEQQLTALGSEGYLINTARAALVDENALIAALNSGTIAGAALDVFWEEPLRRDHPILSAPNTILTPHIAGASIDVRLHHTSIIYEGLRALRSHHAPTNAVVSGLPINNTTRGEH
jgi:D-3-phosphoglycerate dehydrogenase / 2-oxoglutarate reductase